MKIHRHPARQISSVASIVALILATLVLAGCETTGFGGWSGAPGESRAERLSRNGDHAQAAGIYIGLAANEVGSARDRLTLLAVEQWLDGGDLMRASKH